MKPPLRIALVITGLLLLMLGAFGFLVLLSGIVPLSASSGHWRITRAILELGKRRSVDTHTLALETPNLAQPAAVFRGAGHYETGCGPCHGRPGSGPPAVALAMLPSPPELSSRVHEWEPRELFYIVKHGIKLTGMPAWPSQRRDDEVWAVTAFLLELPKLGAAGYDRLVFGAGESPEVEPSQSPDLAPASASLASSCTRCHGVAGRGRQPSAVPKLYGQRPEYFTEALRAFATDERHSGIMRPIAANLTPEQVGELARVYAVAAPQPDTANAAALEGAAQRGEVIARVGIVNQGIPACSDCHGPASSPRNPRYPALAGQYAEYLLLQLELFKGARRGGSTYAPLMQHVAARLDADQMRDVAAYYAALPAP